MNKKRGILFTGILALEVLALLITCAERLRSHENDMVEYPADTLTLAQEYEDGSTVCTAEAEIDGTAQGKNRRIIAPSLTLRRGVYGVLVSYQTDTPSHSSAGCHTRAVCNAEYPWIHSESVMLTDKSVNAEYFVYCSKNDTEVEIKSIMDDECTGTVRIDQITVTYLRGRSAVKDAVLLLLLFAVLDIALWLYLFCRQASVSWLQRNGLAALTLLTLLFLVELPMTINYVPKGYDLRFHYYRIYTLAEGLRDGVFPVKIQPEWFNGYGYATGIFYGDVLLYLPAALYCMGFSMGTVYKIYVLLINILTIGNSYICFKTISRDRYIGLFGTAVYATFLHRLVALYTRAALGSYTVMAFWPLLVLGFWAIYYGKEKEYRRGWVYLTAGSAGIIGSHVLGSLMTALFAGLFLLLSARETFRKKTLLGLGKAAAGCLLSNLFFIVPFLDIYQSMTLTTYHGNKPLYYNSAFIPQLFSTVFNAVADVKEDLQGMNQDMPMSIGPMSGIVIFAALCFLVYGSKKEKEDNRLLKKLLVLIFLSLWMATNLFPYMWLEEYIPAVYAVLRKFEFAWRFLASSSLFVTLLYIALMMKAVKYFHRKRVMAVGGLVCALFCFQGAGYLFQYDNLMIPFEYEYGFRDLTVKAVYDGAYLPEGTDFLEMTADVRVSDSEHMSAVLTAREGTSVEVFAENSSGSEAYIEFPLLMYKGYHVRCGDSGRELLVSYGENNRLRAAVPSGFAGSIRASFEEPWYWRGAEIISLLFWGWLVWYLVRRRKGEYF